MQRVAIAVLALLFASAVGGWLATRVDPVAVDSPAHPAAPTATETSAPPTERGSIVVPRVTREPRDDVDAHGHDHGHGDDGADHGADPRCRVVVQVHDEFGRAVVATVTLWNGAAELGRASTSAEGLASIELDAAPRTFRLRATADGYVDVDQEIRRGADEALIDQLVILRSADGARLTGVVVDEASRPLDPSWLGLLGPEHERDPGYLAMAIGLTGVPRVIASTTSGGRLADTLVTDIDPVTGGFELEVPASFAGDVSFVFGERVLAREAWRVGDGPVLLTVTEARRTEAVGTLEIDVVDDAGAPVRPCAIAIAPDRFSFADEPMTRTVDVDLDDGSGPLVIDHAPAVAIIVQARPSDPTWSSAVQAVHVEGGTTTRVRLVVGRAASVRLWFVPERDSMAMSGPSDLRCILPSGFDAPIVVDDAYDGERIGARVDGIPPGPVAFEHDGNLLMLRLGPGENPDEHWRISALEAFTVRFAPAAGRRARGLDALSVGVEVRTEADLPILRTFETPEWVDDSTAEFVEWLAPGRYRIVLDQGDGVPTAREFVLLAGAQDTTVDFR